MRDLLSAFLSFSTKVLRWSHWQNRSGYWKTPCGTVHTFLEVYSAGLQKFIHSLNICSARPQLCAKFCPTPQDFCILFIQTPQDLKPEVFSFTKSPKSGHFTHSISTRKLGRGQNQVEVYFVAMWGYDLGGQIPCESFLEGHGRTWRTW